MVIMHVQHTLLTIATLSSSVLSWNWNVILLCENNWILADNSCYYWTTVDQVTWSQARTECQSRGSDLLVIDTPKEQSWVGIQTMEYTVDGWWVGLSYSLVQNTWQWLDSSVDITQIQWDIEPDNFENQDCIAINEYNRYSDESCRDTLPYICKIITTRNHPCPVYLGALRWNIVGDVCLYISDPADRQDRYSWQNARTRCQNLKPAGFNGSMDLMSVTSGGLHDLLTGILPVLSNAGMAVKWWTGLNDIAQESIYKWSDGSVWNSTLTKWDRPDTNRSENQNCGIMYSGGIIDDNKCTVRAGYVCETNAVHKTLDFGCPAKWIRGGSSCYYIGNTTIATWTSARAFCQNHAADLLKLDNQDELYWLTHTYISADGKAFWTGLNDQASHGTFRWTDGSAMDASIVVWNKEPNDIASQRCAKIGWNGKFRSADCSTRNGFICIYPKSPGSNCGSGWLTYNNEYCHYISSANHSQQVLWSEVHRRCMDLTSLFDGGLQPTILYITNTAHMTWLKNQLFLVTTPTAQWWTGLNDQATIGVWEWTVNNPVNSGVISWSSAPDNFGGNEHCSAMMNFGTFNDLPCTVQAHFICETLAVSAAPGPRVWTLFASLQVVHLLSYIR